MQKKSLEVLTKLSAVLILDLPDFIRHFILNLKNKLDAYIKRILNKGEKSHKGVDEFEILKWLIHKISLDLEQVPKHKHKEGTCCSIYMFFYSIVRYLRFAIITVYEGGKNPQRCVQLSANTYKKYFGLNKDLKLKFERNLNINFYPEKLW